MRLSILGLSFLTVAGVSIAAPHKTKGKKKPPPDTTAPKDSGEIEMDGSGSAMHDEPKPAAAPAAPPATVTAAPEPMRPLLLDTRPLTIPKGTLELHGALPIAVVPVIDVMGNKVTASSEGLAFGGSYGIDDKTEIGADYAVSINPGSVKGPLTLHGAYHVFHSGKLDAAVAAAFVVEPIDFTVSGTTGTTTVTYAAFAFGAWLRYHVTDKVSLFTGQPALPHESLSLSREAFALPPLAYQLVLGVNNSGAIALELPAGVGVQATPKIYAFAALNLANLKIAHTANAFLFKDFIPLVIGAFYSLDRVDLGLTLADDLEQGDYLNLQLVVRYYLK